MKNSPMKKMDRPLHPRRVRGFSLVELMVSVVIGLLAVLFATRIMANNESNKDAALGASDSMQNGMLALFSVSNDIEQAGFGINDRLVTGCNTVFKDTEEYELPSVTVDSVLTQPLAPVLIEAGAGSAPDRLTLFAGSAPGATPILRLSGNYNGGTTLGVDRRPFGFAKGDVIVVAPEIPKVKIDPPPDPRCALAQVGENPGAASELKIGGTGLRFNNGGLGVLYTGNAARVFNLGPGEDLSFHTWSLEDGYLRLRATNLGNASKSSKPVADNIVAFKAQYGLDTRPVLDFETSGRPRVDTWSSTMVDADNNAIKGNPGDYGRVVAVRLALVARSRNPEKPAADGTCSATTTMPTVFSTDQPNATVKAVPVKLDLAVKDDPIKWQCYRYRVFETIVPLRNAAWRS